MLEKKELSKIYYAYIGLFILIHAVNSISLASINGVIALITGIIWMITTLFLYFFYIKKKKRYIIIYSTINAIFAGITISSYYSIKQVIPYNPLAMILIFTSIMLINYKYLVNSDQKKEFAMNNIIGSIIAIFMSIFVWIALSSSVGSSLVFMIIIYLCFNTAVFKMTEQGSIILATASMLMFAGVLIAVIQALMEGDGIDILFDGWFGSNKNKTQ